jgi:hypothetical protein
MTPGNIKSKSLYYVVTQACFAGDTFTPEPVSQVIRPVSLVIHTWRRNGRFLSHQWYTFLDSTTGVWGGAHRV